MQRVCLFCATALVLVGCASQPSQQVSSAESGAVSGEPPAMIVTPGQSLSGRVALANMQLHYVVLTFPIGSVPQSDQQFNLYRDGLKVGEIRVTGMQRDNNAIADILTGEARVGDEVR